MRPLVLLVMLAFAAGAAYAQDNATSSGGNETAAPGAGNETSDAPAPPQAVTFTLIGHATPTTYWEVEGLPGRNPTITVPAGAEVTFVVRQGAGESTPHNLKVGDHPVSTESIVAEGDEFVYRFTAPASGGVTYVCVIHGSAMSGTVRVQAAGQSQEPGEEEQVNGATVSLKEVAPDATCDRQIPAIVTRNTVGGRTLDDYKASCVQTEGAGGPQDHPADLVIPLSFLAMGLGVAGLVWVHKHYKP